MTQVQLAEALKVGTDELLRVRPPRVERAERQSGGWAHVENVSDGHRAAGARNEARTVKKIRFLAHAPAEVRAVAQPVALGIPKAPHRYIETGEGKGSHRVLLRRYHHDPRSGTAKTLTSSASASSERKTEVRVPERGTRRFERSGLPLY